MTKQKTIIAGSGLSALMMARMIKLYRDPAAEIIIIERDENIGGQFGSFNYGPNGYFDIGMHIYYESCIPEIDKLFTDLLPESEWNILENNHKDVAGLFVNNKLQTKTPYVDLRKLPEAQWKKYVAEIFFTIQNNKGAQLPPDSSTYDILKHHFGKITTDEIFVPILEKLYLTHPSNLAEIATQLTAINRVALFDEEVMLDLMQSPEVRARICYPDQFTLPSYRENSQRGFYPKSYGMFRVLEKLKSLLEVEGVKFLTSSTVSNLEITNKKVTALTVINKDSEQITFPVKELFWTAGLPSLAKVLGIRVDDLSYDKKQTEGMYVNFLFDKEPSMEELYYFYCFDKGYRSFRVTNYNNYCPSAAANRGYPVCVEFWAQEGDVKTEEGIIMLAQKELKEFGIIDDSYKIHFAKVEKLAGGGFPLPSVRNIANMNTINKRICHESIENVIATGVLTEKNVFFIKDVLIDTYSKVIKGSKNQKNPVNVNGLIPPFFISRAI